MKTAKETGWQALPFVNAKELSLALILHYCLQNRKEWPLLSSSVNTTGYGNVRVGLSQKSERNLPSSEQKND